MLQLVVTGSVANVLTPLQRLAGPQLRRALGEGLNQGGDKTRTKVRRALREQTNVKRARAINDRTDSIRLGRSTLEYRIRAMKRALPIAEVAGTKGTDAGVASAPWGRARTFQRSFEKGGRGSGVYRARLGSKRFPIRSLFGPSVAKELPKDRSLAAFQLGVRVDVVPAILRRLARAMGR